MSWKPRLHWPVAGRWLIWAGLPLVLVLILIVIGLRFRWFQKQPAGGTPVEGPFPAEVPELARGKQLYTNYCLACHGEKGSGDGPAARYLYPKPRNFGEAKFRLVTTVNHMPSDEDLMQVLNRGLPGSAMFPFSHLSVSDRRALVVYVRHLTQVGSEERVRREKAAQGEEIDPDELSATVAEIIRPGHALEMPAHLPASGTTSINRGRQLYLASCAPCHGETGKGDGVQQQRDDDGMPTRPRDFTRGIFKGGRDPRALYARIVLGMPGTPMPSTDYLKPPQAGDLINFLLSLSDPAASAKVEHKRLRIVVRRSTAKMDGRITEGEWRGVPAVHVVVTPLWWRNYAEPDLQVQTLHDGRTLAIRLSWRDSTRNDQAVRPQDFQDMAAVQLFKGSPEPFLGMGAGDKPVDVWLWRAGSHTQPSQYADVDTVYPRMAVDLYPFERPANGLRPHATERQPAPFLTALAAGNLQADPARPLTGSNLQAKGPGTLTMRPRISQVVTARGQWQHGGWTIVLRRPLEVGQDAGISLAPGDQLSIAFAIWDGAAGDRNGQKLVSIWHDLLLE